MIFGLTSSQPNLWYMYLQDIFVAMDGREAEKVTFEDAWNNFITDLKAWGYPFQPKYIDQGVIVYDTNPSYQSTSWIDPGETDPMHAASNIPIKMPYTYMLHNEPDAVYAWWLWWQGHQWDKEGGESRIHFDRNSNQNLYDDSDYLCGGVEERVQNTVWYWDHHLIDLFVHDSRLDWSDPVEDQDWSAGFTSVVYECIWRSADIVDFYGTSFQKYQNF